MLKFLLKLWPAATPVVIYIIWRLLRRGKKGEAPLSRAESRLWIITLALSLVIAIICIVVTGVDGEQYKKPYERPDAKISAEKNE
jgi:predicted Co/Zn/Cd cation transporter (cation efflux family)